MATTCDDGNSIATHTTHGTADDDSQHAGSSSSSCCSISSSTDMSLSIPETFICPLTLDVMTEPVMDRLGNVYEKSAILEWVCEHGTCPMTRKPMGPRNICSHGNLRREIEIWKEHHDYDANIELFQPTACRSDAKPLAQQERAAYECMAFLERDGNSSSDVGSSSEEESESSFSKERIEQERMAAQKTIRKYRQGRAFRFMMGRKNASKKTAVPNSQ